MLQAILALALTPMIATAELPATCSFPSAQDAETDVGVTLTPTRPAFELLRRDGAIIAIDGDEFHGNVRVNGATKARDVLVTLHDEAGRKIVLAVHESGSALLVREMASGSVEERQGKCGLGGEQVRRWFNW
jgi:hypothetical protein